MRLPGGAMDRNPLANARAMVSIHGPGGSHMSKNNWAGCITTTEAWALRQEKPHNEKPTDYNEE